MATTINRTNWTALVDDDGSNTVGTIWTKDKIKTVLLDPIDVTLAAVGSNTSTVLTTGNITALPIPAGNEDLFILMANGSLATIQGIVAGLHGQRLTLLSVGGGQVDVSPLDAAATAANRVQNFASVGKTSMVGNTGVMVFQYDATAAVTRWRLITHEQGGWITPAYATANFAPAAPTWTVDAGDVTSYAYRLTGRALTVSWYLQTTSVTLAPTNLRIAIPAGLVAAKQSLHPCVHDDNGAGNAGTFALINAGSTTIDTYKAYGVGSFATATNTTRLFGTVTFEVQ